MNTGLTNRQISLILYAVTVGYGIIDLPKDVASSAGTGGWVTLALSTLLLMFMTYIITTTQYNNPGKTLDEYSSDIFGSIITKIIIISYILYFLTIFTMITRMYSEIIKLLFLNKTPVWSTMILFYGVVFLAVIKRLNAIARLVELYITIAIFGIISTIIFIFSYGEIINMKPFFVRSDIFKYIGAIRKLLFAFIGVEILYMIPMDKKKNRSILKYNLITVGLIGIIYILIFESNISITGIRGIINQKSTLFQVLRGIDIQYLDILKRFDGFFFIFWSMDILCSTSIWLYGTAFFTKKIFPKISFIKITIFIVLVSFILSILPRKISQVKSVLSVVSKVSPLFLIVMPIIIYIGVKVKNNEKISD